MLRQPDFRHVLCGIDGSASSCRAAETAIRIAETFGADLTLLAVVGKAKVEGAFKGYLEDEGLRGQSLALLPDTTGYCLDKAEARARWGGARVARIVRVGHPARVMESIAADEKVDCLVIGRGQGLSLRSLFGRSLERRMLRSDVPCRVLVVT